MRFNSLVNRINLALTAFTDKPSFVTEQLANEAFISLNLLLPSDVPSLDNHENKKLIPEFTWLCTNIDIDNSVPESIAFEATIRYDDLSLNHYLSILVLPDPLSGVELKIKNLSGEYTHLTDDVIERVKWILSERLKETL
jgi:hypothetical protein